MQEDQSWIEDDSRPPVKLPRCKLSFFIVSVITPAVNPPRKSSFSFPSGGDQTVPLNYTPVFIRQPQPPLQLGLPCPRNLVDDPYRASLVHNLYGFFHLTFFLPFGSYQECFLGGL